MHDLDFLFTPHCGREVRQRSLEPHKLLRSLAAGGGLAGFRKGHRYQSREGHHPCVLTPSRASVARACFSWASFHAVSPNRVTPLTLTRICSSNPRPASTKITKPTSDRMMPRQNTKSECCPQLTSQWAQGLDNQLAPRGINNAATYASAIICAIRHSERSCLLTVARKSGSTIASDNPGKLLHGAATISAKMI